MNPALIFRLILLIIAVALNTLLALLVFRNNPKSSTNKVFSLLSFFVSVWLAANYVALMPKFLELQNVFWARMTIVLAMPMSALFFLFAQTMPSKKISLKRFWLILVVLSTLIVMG